MANNEAVENAQERLKKLLDTIRSNEKNPLVSKVSEQLKARVENSMNELKKAEAKEKEQIDQINKIADTTNAMIDNFDKIISGDPITSITGVLGMISGVAGLAGGPAGAVVGAVCSVITTILSFFGSSGPSELELQREMIRE